ncbi:MAG: hypothetical protein DRN96_06710 [Thermoproteota archaeon]|nr:MAG: hypothetical protein DRN96_06710 [Candidatus Korarchaeota archaeon]RLG55013.1 MAG: hypothetical protein DRN99_03930 [Candidatus Korarchaeota archaeon]
MSVSLKPIMHLGADGSCKLSQRAGVTEVMLHGSGISIPEGSMCRMQKWEWAHLAELSHLSTVSSCLILV